MKKTNFKRPRYVLKNNFGEIVRSYKKKNSFENWYEGTHRDLITRMTNFIINPTMYVNPLRSINVDTTDDSAT